MRTHTQIIASLIRYRWAMLAAAALLAFGIASAALAFGTHTVQGTPTANRDQVVAVQQEKAAALAKQQADEAAAYLASLNDQVHTSMQGYFNDPANGMTGENIVVTEVSLINSTGNQYEGEATMSANGGTPRQILIHVLADAQNIQWKTDPGALLPLFQ